MFNKYDFVFLAILGLTISPVASAAQTAIGKVGNFIGHTTPACRMVMHRENATGIQRWFRVRDVAGKDDVTAVALAALMGNRDTTINYQEGVTTGCGGEPAITYITIY